MAKIGRNDQCPCGQRKKFKKCCGDPAKETFVLTQTSPNKISPEIKMLFERKRAAELTRQQQQGLGKPIIEAKFKDHQIVAVGNRAYFLKKASTFPDFLASYLPDVMGREWCEQEFVKPYEERHPILQWYAHLAELQQKYAENSEKEIHAMPSTGAVYCYLGLSYNLYLLKHNVELQERFINRLKDINNFQGAYYELIVSNCLIRAGFDLTLEDETDESSKHCEFAAVSKKTGKKYWVEAKSRSVIGVLGKVKNNGTNDKEPTSSLSRHINDALKKPAADERMIFADVNAEDDFQSVPAWVETAGKKLKQRAINLKPGEAAYVFVTNMNFHLHLGEENRGHSALAHGLGIPDFAKEGHLSLQEIYKQKQKHIDAHNVFKAFEDYPKIPSTFDGSLPSETFSKTPRSLKIGEKYFFDDIGENGLIATITSATVMESEKIVLVGTDSGAILTRPMTDDEIADYKSHPDTYFGVIHKQGKKADSPYEFFEHLVEIHMTYSRGHFLKQIEHFPDAGYLKALSHENLVLAYCERVTWSAFKMR